MSRIDLFTLGLAIMVFTHGGTHAVAVDSYEISFSTFLGGSDWEHARDVLVDDDGNVYLAGGTQSANFPTTNGALQRQQDMSGKQIGSGGHCDACAKGCSATIRWRQRWERTLL